MDGSEDLGAIRSRRSILRFTLPSMAMMLFISSYSVVDGAFISNFVGSDALASISILMPVVSLLTGVGFMFSTGGSAHVANLLGAGKRKEADGAFSLLVAVIVALSLLFIAVFAAFMDPLIRLMGADDVLAGGCAEYAFWYLPGIPFLVLQFILTQFIIVAGRPGLSLAVSVAGGLANIALDYVFIALLGFGLAGAAVASGIGSAVPAVAGILFFMRPGRGLGFGKPAGGARTIVSVCSNGASEMVSEISSGISILCYNMVMMSHIGPDGVAAITLLDYVQFLALAAIIGYSNGVAPVMSYDHGAGDKEGMRAVFGFSAGFVASLSLAVFVLMELFSREIAGFFVGGSEGVMEIAVDGARIFSIGFLFMGFNVYASSLFTSLSNGFVSALISFIRSLVLLVPLIVLLPMLFGIGAVWAAVPLTEGATVLLSACLVVCLGKRYGYLEPRRSAA